MLQFLDSFNDRYSLAEQAQMAIEGGCTWIVLAIHDAPADNLRETVADTVAVCREASAILTIVNEPEKARELGIHGVLITDPEHFASPSAMREQLGPEAIIGYAVASLASIPLLAKADIDYAVVMPELVRDGKGATIVGEARASGHQMPIVAMGDFTPDDIPALIKSGYSGVLTGHHIIGAADPVKYMEDMLVGFGS